MKKHDMTEEEIEQAELEMEEEVDEEELGSSQREFSKETIDKLLELIKKEKLMK